jgi:DNA-binding NarL/FixJ family response regulator
MPDPADYYREIYARGLGGETPAIPVSVAELEERAMAAIDPKAANYVGAGAGSEETIRANREAFRRRRIVPRMLRDVSSATSRPRSSAPRCRRRSCWRRSASSTASMRRASWQPRAPPPRSACR